MHRTTISTLLIAALLMLPGGKLVAYPISPVTLWELVSQSDQIIVARVTALCDLKVTIDGDTIRLKNEIAILEVLETWKGKPLKRIEVVIGSDEICPAPAVYVKDKTVLAFLQKRYNKWNTCGLSYGSLYPGREDLEVFRDRVKVIATNLISKPVATPDLRDRLPFRSLFVIPRLAPDAGSLLNA